MDFEKEREFFEKYSSMGKDEKAIEDHAENMKKELIKFKIQMEIFEAYKTLARSELSIEEIAKIIEKTRLEMHTKIVLEK